MLQFIFSTRNVLDTINMIDVGDFFGITIGSHLP